MGRGREGYPHNNKRFVTLSSTTAILPKLLVLSDHLSNAALGGSSPLPRKLAVKRSPHLAAQMAFAATPLPPTTQWTAEDVSLNSAHLEDFFHRDRVRLPSADDYLSAGMSTAPTEVIQRLAEWTMSTPDSAGGGGNNSSTASNILWIDGPPLVADDLDNEISLLSATVVSMADRSSVPVMSYFCELRRREALRPGVRSMEMQGFLAMVYSLLRQMVETLMPVIEVDPADGEEVDFSAERFARLDGTIETWDQVVDLFKDVVPLCPGRVFVVIDGLHWVDGRDTEAYIEQLVGLLRENGKRFKVLFTTSGRVPTLRKVIKPEEALLVEAVDPGMMGRDYVGPGLSMA